MSVHGVDRVEVLGDSRRETTSTEVRDLRRENSSLKQVVAETVFANRILKTHLRASGSEDDTCD